MHNTSTPLRCANSFIQAASSRTLTLHTPPLCAQQLSLQACHSPPRSSHYTHTHIHHTPPFTQHDMTSFVQPVPQPPSCSFSDFELGRYVHAGGYGTVYSATRKADGKRVALVSGVDPATLSLTHSIYCIYSITHTNSQFCTSCSKARY